MHISLDAALGRQRRLNQIGESITQIAPDPAAAYSLRSLTGGDPKVVRVRRGSDNHEQDFTASEVSSGALVDFVNAQVTAPLDIQALSATGRDGDFLIAKAAYSLRSLGTRQATLAATGDTVARANGKFVCQVRRSSDDALKSFTATEVTDGTLLSFVNEDILVYTQPSDLDISAGSGTFFSLPSYTESNTVGHTFKVSFELKRNSGGSGSSGAISVRNASTWNYTTITKSSNLDAKANRFEINTSSEEYQTYSFTATTDAGSNDGPLRFRTFDSDDSYTVKNFTVEITGSNGFVKTWYDQSVTTQAGDTATGNHATQATAANQPKIVSAGALVVDNGIGGLDFDGDDFLTASSVSGLEGSISMFAVSVRDATGYVVSPSNSSSGAKYFGIQEGASTSVANPRNTSSVTVSDSVSGNDRLTFAVTTGATSTSVGANGSAVTTTTSDYGDNFAGSDIDQIGIGLLRTVSASGHFDGRIREILVYSSDQTDNRTAIEANIGEVYSITGIPAYDNTVDGFVETWYDQSGNSNDVTQSTASKQPKIVNAGSLVTVNSKASFKFDGTDDFLERETYTQGTLSQPNTFFSVAKLDAYADENRKVYDSHLSTARNMLQLSTTGNGQFAHFAGTVAATGEDADADRHLFTSLLNGAASNLRIDSTSKTTATTNTQGMTGIVIGANYDTANNFWDGDMQEIIVYNSNETSNFTALETNINGHYSLF